MNIAGIDDAGRGSVIGPLAIAGVLVNENDLPRLVDLGVKDSKRLSPRKRQMFAEEIEKLSLEYSVAMLSPPEIDRVVEHGKRLHKLNRLEAVTMAAVINKLKPDVAYVDASDVSTERFKAHILEKLNFKTRIISEHKADVKYPVVSAASIIAKVKRDQAIFTLRNLYRDIGSGYPSDPITILFLKNWIKKFGSYPDFVRKSWKPAKRFLKNSETEQPTLSDFVEGGF